MLAIAALSFTAARADEPLRARLAMPLVLLLPALVCSSCWAVLCLRSASPTGFDPLPRGSSYLMPGVFLAFLLVPLSYREASPRSLGRGFELARGLATVASGMSLGVLCLAIVSV